MATGNSSLVSSSVLLWDRLNSANGGSGLVLHPETELAAVVMTPGGGIISSGNSLYLDASSAWGSGIGSIVSGSYCPLVAVVSGATQYAEMHVSGATATHINLDGSTGYGTLVNSIGVITSVHSVESATNSSVPTELAVAVALSGKANVLSGGSCISLENEAFYTVVGVNVATAIATIADSASHDKVPTEKAVFNALGEVAAGASSYTDSLHTTINNSNYATVTYVNQAVADATFTLNPATANTLGGVKVPTDGGIVVNNGAISVPMATVYADYTTAAAGSAGRVKVLKNITGNTNYTNSAYVPTVQAVIDYVSGATFTLSPATSNTLGGVKVPNDGGIVLTTGSTAGELSLAVARYVTDKNTDADTNDNSVQLGGVRVVLGYGIGITGDTVNAGGGIITEPFAGNIYVTGASVYASFATAAAGGMTGAFGGVRAVKKVEPATDAVTAEYPIVPTTDAVYGFVHAIAAGGDFAVTEDIDTDVPDGHMYTIAAGSVYLDGLSTVFKSVDAHTYRASGDTAWELWARIPYAGTVSYADSPVFTGTTTSVPIAYITGATVRQHQHGPIVIRGRWA